MQAIVKNSEGYGVECIDIERPSPKDYEVLINVEVAAICGTDVHYYYWDAAAKDFGQKFGIKFPFVLGHECSGTIVEVGKKVKKRKVGQKVSIETHIPCGECFACQTGIKHNCSNMRIYGTSCNGCFASFAIVDEDNTFVLPEEISFKEGALLEPAGVAMHAVEKSNITPGDTVVVNGCGPIGLFIIQILMVSGAAKVFAIDKDEYRLNLAKKIGGIPINLTDGNIKEKIYKYTNERKGADIVFEASGASSAYSTILKIIRNEGILITVGHPETTVEFDVMKDINIKGITIKGIFGRRIWNTWWNLTSLIVSKKINLLDVVTHCYTFSQCDEAFEQIKKGSGKVLLIGG